MSNYKKLYLVPPKKTIPLDQLIQLLRIVWDGDLICKGDRDYLVEIGFAKRTEGFNIITPLGINHLISLDRLKP